MQVRVRLFARTRDLAGADAVVLDLPAGATAGERRATDRGTMIRLTTDPIDYHALTEQVRRPGCGAVVTFLGTVRDLTGDRVTLALDYEAYPAMAEKKM